MSWCVHSDQNGSDLLHYGILGMRWGVRRTPEQLGHIKSSIRITKQGRTEIEKGSSVTRLITGSNGVFRGNVAYASVLDYDVSRYISLAASGKFGSNFNPDKIVHMTAKERLVSPSTDEATSILGELLASNKNALDFTSKVYGRPMSEKDARELIENPSSSFSKSVYFTYNWLFTLPGDASRKELGVDHTKVMNDYISILEKNGYNMLRDENDFLQGVTKSPVIIFNPQKSLNIISIDDITSETVKLSKETLKEYGKLGRKWMEEYVYEKG